MTDKTKKGLLHKFNVQRVDGSDAPGGKHYGCEYFTLDLTHDKHALAALSAYAKSCESEYPMLAADLRSKVAAKRALYAHESFDHDVRKDD
jgi:hypothetical protein